MDGMDWSIVIVVLALLLLALFFGWTEHLETMAGCLASLHGQNTPNTLTATLCMFLTMLATTCGCGKTL